MCKSIKINNTIAIKFYKMQKYKEWINGSLQVTKGAMFRIDLLMYCFLEH